MVTRGLAVSMTGRRPCRNLAARILAPGARHHVGGEACILAPCARHHVGGALMLLGVTMLLTLAICSCHTTHTATEHTTRQTQAAAVSHAREQSNVTADWWQSVRLAVDSAVVVFGDTLGGAGVLSSPGSRNEMATLSQPRASPRPAKVKLYGLRHATDAAMHTEVNTEREQNDSTHITGVTATDTSSREEVTGVARPPDVTIVLLLLAVAAVMYFRIKLFSKD